MDLSIHATKNEAASERLLADQLLRLPGLGNMYGPVATECGLHSFESFWGSSASSIHFPKFCALSSRSTSVHLSLSTSFGS